jgi:ABC-2 type transport system permease protein
MLGELIIVVLGALTITSEYGTGMISTSLTVMPRRVVLLAAKAIVFTAVMLAVSLPTSFAAYFAGQATNARGWFGGVCGCSGTGRAEQRGRS